MSKDAFGYNEQLPENIKDVFIWLWQDVVSLQSKWDFFSELFGNKPNTDLLSILARASFNIIYDSLLNDITMAVCRLSDPIESGPERENLSFSTLGEMCNEVEGLDTLLTNFQEICEPVKKIRNKRVGHRDLKTAIKPLENPLPGITNQLLEQILKSATNILNTVYQNYDNGELYFHEKAPGGADALIYWLNKGKASKDMSNSVNPSPL